MNPLDTQRLFLDCPYPVKQDGSEYTFKTEHDIVYSVDFKEEQTFSPIPAYWFDLTNLSHKPSPNDPKQAQRNRLFLRWFMGAEQSKLFFIKTAQVTDDGIDNFIAIIVPRQHQYLNEIIARFDAEIAMFQSNKPE